MSVITSDPPAFQKLNPLYSSITSVPLSSTATLVTVAGQVAEDPQTGETSIELSAQLDLRLFRLTICLQYAGTKKSDITRLMYYITQSAIAEIDRKEGKGAALKLIAQKVGSWLEGHRPASCFLRVFGMSDEKLLCEFECMAVVAKTDSET